MKLTISVEASPLPLVSSMEPVWDYSALDLLILERNSKFLIRMENKTEIALLFLFLKMKEELSLVMKIKDTDLMMAIMSLSEKLKEWLKSMEKFAKLK